MSDTGSGLPPWVERGTRGFVFATTGEGYTTLARRAARNLRLLIPACNIDLFTDQVADDRVFDRVHMLGNSWFRPKMQALRESRFERSIVLDADIVVVADISEVFEILDQCDIAGVEAVSRDRLMVPPQMGVPRCFPPINTGFLAVRASQKLCDFTRSWEDSVRQNAALLDQPQFRRQLYRSDLKFLPLGGEYNLLALRRLDFQGKKEGAPRVLHVRDLHDRPPGDPETPFSLVESIGETRAAHVERLIAADWSLGGNPSNDIVTPAMAVQSSKIAASDHSRPSLLRQVFLGVRRRISPPPPPTPPQQVQAWRQQGYTPYQSAVLALAATRDCLQICVVGANDGRFGDPIYPLVSRDLATRTEIILFEPQEYLIPYLSNHYAFHPRHKIVNAAIGPSSDLELHVVKPEAWSFMSPPYAKAWPQYRAPTGVASSERRVVLSWVSKHCPDHLDPESMVAKLSVSCSPLVEAFEKLKHPLQLDVLQIDAEGMDDEVLYSCDIEQTTPSIVLLERSHLSPDRVQKLRRYLERDYFLSVHNRDLLAIRRASPSARRAP